MTEELVILTGACLGDDGWPATGLCCVLWRGTNEIAFERGKCAVFSCVRPHVHSYTRLILAARVERNHQDMFDIKLFNF